MKKNLLLIVIIFSLSVIGYSYGASSGGANDGAKKTNYDKGAYIIKKAKKYTIMVDTHSTAKVDEEKIEECIKELFDLSPKGIIQSLDLFRPIYRKTAVYGHFGREEDGFTWEETNRADEIKNYLGL